MSYRKITDWRIAAADVPADGSVGVFLKEKLRSLLHLSGGAEMEFRILNRGVDSRRGIPEFVYSFEVCCGSRPPEWDELRLMPDLPSVMRLGSNPLIIGAGPAGLFAAYVLAAAGKNPLVIERGAPVEERTADIESFRNSRLLLPESNFLFGEGGAGTFSDGKLYTRIKDENASCITDIMIACGADEGIRWLKRPHLGSDRLPVIIRNLRERIISMGGRFLFHTKAEALSVQNGRCNGVFLADGTLIEAPAVLSAHGSGARDWGRVIASMIPCELKSFQIGTRIEHPQLMIDRRQYRCRQRPPALEAAEYFVNWRNQEGPGVASFCMCPGGTVVPAVAVAGHLSTNGMSNAARDGEFANSCLITTLDGSQFADPAAAWEFLERLERKAFNAGGGNYDFPAQSVKSYLSNMRPELSAGSGAFFPLRPYRMKKIYPACFNEVLPQALRHFDKLMPGFIGAGTLIGIETTVSSPVRIPRNENGASPLPGFRSAGEGSGHAGGIISAACDGFKQAVAMLAEGK